MTVVGYPLYTVSVEHQPSNNILKQNCKQLAEVQTTPMVHVPDSRTYQEIRVHLSLLDWDLC